MVQKSKNFLKNNRKLVAVILLLLLSSLTFCDAASIANFTVEFDSNGNLKQDLTNYYEYNALNQLVKIRQGGSNGTILVEYFYDYDGSRIKKVEYNSTITTTYYFGEEFMQVVNSSGVSNSAFYSLNGVLVAENTNGKTNFYLNDHLGSPEFIVNNSGQIISSMEYLPFGLELNSSSARFGFTGQERDGNLMFYDSRYYSPYFGRFIQPDTILPNIYDPQQINRYSYARNNPVKYTDPEGHFLDTILDVGFIIWDIVDIVINPFSKSNWVGLGLDVVSAFVPFMAGAGRIYKASSKAVSKASKLDNVAKAGKSLLKNKKAQARIGLGIADAGSSAKKASKTTSTASKTFKELSKDPVFRSTAKEFKTAEKVGASNTKISIRNVDEGRAILNNAGYKEVKAFDGPVSKAPKNTPGTFRVEEVGSMTGHGSPGNLDASADHINIFTSKKNKLTMVVDDFAK